MKWTPVTERDYDPKPPKTDGIDFCLTPQERDNAKIVSIALERNRRKQNQIDLEKASIDWFPGGDAA